MEARAWGWVLEPSGALGVAVSRVTTSSLALSHFRPPKGSGGWGEMHLWASPTNSCPGWLGISATAAS